MLAYDYPLLSVFMSLLWFFLFVLWFWLLITILTDVFRSHDLGGFAKTLWVLFVIFLPFLGVFVYLIARGQKMHEHAASDVAKSDAAFKQYVQETVPTVTPADQQRYTAMLGSLTPEQQQRLNDSQSNFYELSLRNVGGLVMPVIVQMTYADNTQEVQTIPAEIWRKNNAQVTKVIVTKKPVISFVIDPFQQTADTDLSNNAFPRQPAASRFELFEQQRPQAPANPMQQAAKASASPLQKLEQKPGSSGN